MKKLLVFCGIFVQSILLGQNSQDVKINQTLDTVVVTASRANLKSPIAYTKIYKGELEKSSSNYSVPMILALQPSVVATTEGGLGLGYSKLSVRGTDDTRTNVSINGITINDAESQQVFWVNLPSLQSSLKSIQLQRGVGGSMSGTGSFGASINMETLSSYNGNAYGSAEMSYGSYQTFMSSIAAGTGISNSGFSFDVVISSGKTDGYIRNAKAKLSSLFATAGWRDSNNSLKINYIFGDQSTGITWEGNPIYDEDRRYNPAGLYYDDAGNIHYYDNETDNYTQHYIQALYTHSFSNALSWSTVFNFTKGDGYYENYKYNAKFSKYGLENQVIDGVTYKKSDFIIRQGLDNSYYAATTFLNYKKRWANMVLSLSYSNYNGAHPGTVIWSKYNQNIPDNAYWYDNNGKKDDFSAFVKGDFSLLDNLSLYLDLQYRGVNYSFSGMDKDFVDLNYKNSYNFFNPKAGLSYFIGANSKVYASLFVGHKEPTRSDIKESIKDGKGDDIKSERVLDYELGYTYSNSKFSVAANIYLMEYKDQLVATGKLTETGRVIKENIPDSYRRGIELSGAWQISPAFRFDANLTLSKNRLKNYTAYIDTYDNDIDWNPVNQTKLYFKESNLILSPECVGMAMFTIVPCKSLTLSVNGKYIGEQYMDNYKSDVSKVPAYFVAGANVVKDFKLKNGSSLALSLNVDNLLNNKYYSYGWIYQAFFANGAANYLEKGVYAQAPINFIFKIACKF